jgi:hypothetical protein
VLVQVAVEHRFSPAMLFSSMKQYKVKIGLWIDLTNTTRFYDKQQVITTSKRSKDRALASTNSSTNSKQAKFKIEF